MTGEKPVVGVLMTLLELYRDAHPEMPAKFGAMWRGIVTELLADHAELHFTGVACSPDEVAMNVADCEKAGCGLLMVLPLAYAPSGAAVGALTETDLPVLVVSTARDSTLPHDMSGDHIMANHAMHGVQDLANVLARGGREFELVAGHPSDERFRRRLVGVVRAAAGAAILRAGRAGRIGLPFPGMLDFAYAGMPGEVVAVEPEDLAAAAEHVDGGDVGEVVRWAKERFDVDAELTATELEASARWALSLEGVVAGGDLDAVSLNFLDVASAAGPSGTVPFLGASRLMAAGVGYAGEGDVLTATLMAAVARVADGRATFTEMFCPDYERGEVLLSHMGECNFELASPGAPVRLVAKPFAYGECLRPAVPVFQLAPGEATLASLTEWPGDGFRIVAARCEVVDAPEHPNLQSPYSRISFGRQLAGFLEDYSRAGGTHHLALGYGDLSDGLGALATLCRIGFVSV